MGSRHVLWETLGGSRRLVVTSLALSVLQSLALVPVGLLVRHAFDELIPNGKTGPLFLIGAAILGLYLTSVALGLLSRHMVLGATKPAVTRLRTALAERLQSFSRSHLDRQDVARLHSTIVQDSERVDVMANALLALVLPSAVIGAVLLASLAAIDLRLLALLGTVMPVLVVLSRLLGRRVRSRVGAWQRSFDTFSARILFELRALTLTRVQAAEDQELAAARRDFSDLGRAGHRVAWLSHAYTLVQGAVAAAAGVVVIVVGGAAVASDDMSIGDLLSFFAVLALVRGQLNTLLNAVPGVITGLEAARRLRDLLATDAPEPYQGCREIALEGSVALEGVTFSYGGEPAVVDLSLSVSPGERVAIAGPNGAGKSTVVALLLGLYRPQGGRVLVDGVPLDELDLRSLRRQTGVVLQDALVFRGSVRENIAYGRPDASAEEIRRAAVLATADSFADRLPEGYETQIGDEGELLSAGQRQRVALARALLGSPRLLILDEPTAHLDESTAAALLGNLRRLPQRPAIVMISHDPAVMGDADRVYELREGRLARDSSPARWAVDLA